MTLRLVTLAAASVCALATASRAVTPSQVYSHGDPTGDEQYSLELINRARLNPVAEGIFLGDINDPVINPYYVSASVNRAQVKAEFAVLPAQPPLAFNPKLTAAARFQTQDQIANNYQGHESPTGGTIGSRATAAGYNFAAIGENVFAKVPNVLLAHCGLNVDFFLSATPVHRRAIMSIAPFAPVYKEYGAGYAAATSGSAVTPNVMTQTFGIDLNESSTPFLTGVVYRDLDNNSFYTSGEGLAGVTVTPDEGTFSAVTSSSGGYAIPLKNLTPGATTLRVTFSGGALTSPFVRNVGLNGTANVKADVMVGKARVVNLSTRLRVEGGDNVGIAGFVVSGNNPKRVLIRSLGPSLGAFGVSSPLADPSLEVRDSGQNLVASNDSWKSSQQAQITASGFAPSSDAEPAIVATLNPGSYTAIVRGANSGVGVAIVEVYDLETGGSSYPINVSTRGIVRTGENVMIGGFVLPSQKKVIVRAIGPSLTAFGVTGALANPSIELKNSNGVTVASNDDWKATQQAEIQSSGLAPTNDNEAAIVATLPAGSYTAIVTGVGATSGVALFEVFDLD
ncbi:MAG: hypothetical protein JSR82_04450 [Verrucomicrobia bacterium]|nr:hypothetical protein [Verrucomicrobiota bacterium]